VIPQSLEDMPKADQEIPPLPQHQEQQPEDQLPQEQQQELYQIAPQSQNQVLGLQWHLQNQHAAHERQIQLQQRSHDQIILFKDNEISRLSMEKQGATRTGVFSKSTKQSTCPVDVSTTQQSASQLSISVSFQPATYPSYPASTISSVQLQSSYHPSQQLQQHQAQYPPLQQIQQPRNQIFQPEQQNSNFFKLQNRKRAPSYQPGMKSNYFA
jgi:hypothetical protein